MIRARQLARGDIAAKDDKPNLITSPRMQAAMVIAKSLGSVKGSGQTADFRVSGGTPESIVNQAIREFGCLDHIPMKGGRLVPKCSRLQNRWASSGIIP